MLTSPYVTFARSRTLHPTVLFKDSHTGLMQRTTPSFHGPSTYNVNVLSDPAAPQRRTVLNHTVFRTKNAQHGKDAYLVEACEDAAGRLVDAGDDDHARL